MSSRKTPNNQIILKEFEEQIKVLSKIKNITSSLVREPELPELESRVDEAEIEEVLEKGVRRKQSLLQKKASEDIKDKIQDREERKKYAFKTFKFLRNFTVVILSIVILDQLTQFKLPGKVLIVLISTSFASVISIFAFVMKYLFKK